MQEAPWAVTIMMRHRLQRIMQDDAKENTHDREGVVRSPLHVRASASRSATSSTCLHASRKGSQQLTRGSSKSAGKQGKTVSSSPECPASSSRPKCAPASQRPRSPGSRVQSRPRPPSSEAENLLAPRSPPPLSFVFVEVRRGLQNMSK